MKKIFWFLLIFSLFIGIKNVEALYSPSQGFVNGTEGIDIGALGGIASGQINQNGYFNGGYAGAGGSTKNPGYSGAASGGIGGLGSSDATTPNPSYDTEGSGSNMLDNDQLEYKSCGDVDKIPAPIPKFTSFAYNALKVLTPVVLIVIGSFDLLKSVMAGKEDEIKKAQAGFVKKLLIGGLVFLVALIVQYVIKIAAKAEDSNGAISCMDCFLNEKC